jgi:hypothetical protein
MRGHLVIADISGYTQFLTDNELDHANGIVGDLLNSIIGAMQAPLAVSNIEGDAIFMYGEMADGMVGQTVLESVEMLYCAFASSLENMVLNTTCTCSACVNIQSLGLKIVMHCGEYAMTTVGEMTTLSGPDVIAVHRLLKNRIVEATGVTDYLLVTQACVDELDVAPMVAAWTPHSEEYEHIGVVDGYVSSLRDVWASLQLQTEVKVSPSGAWDTVRGQSIAPPAVIWDHIIDPRKRVSWLAAAVGMELKESDDGRVGPGTEFHCAHGDGDITMFTVLDMRPYDYLTVMVEFVEDSIVKYTYYFMPSGSGTRVFIHAAAPAGRLGEPVPELASDEYLQAWHEMMQENVVALTALADEVALATRAASDASR